MWIIYVFLSWISVLNSLVESWTSPAMKLLTILAAQSLNVIPLTENSVCGCFFSWLGFGRMCLMLTWWPCVPTSVDHPRRPGSHNICHHHLKFKRKYWLIFITVFNGIFELSMNSFFYFFIILWRSSLFYNGYFLIFGRIWELVVFQCLTTLPVVFSASSCVLSFEQIKPFMWIMCIRGYWCLLFQNISFKNGLVAKRMNLWAWNCFLSSQARVTSVHLISSLISLNDELMFFWKSLKLRQNFPDTWDMFLKSCLVWTSRALSLLDQTFWENIVQPNFKTQEFRLLVSDYR